MSEECTGIVKIFDIRFLMDLYVLEYFEHDFAILYKISVGLFLSQSVRDTLAQKLRHRIALNFTHSGILT